MDFTKAIQAMPGFLGSGGRGEKTIAEAEKKLKYTFKDKNLLITAFTHKSLCGRLGADNDRMEFLGDAVLSLVVSDMKFSITSVNGRIDKNRDAVLEASIRLTDVSEMDLLIKKLRSDKRIYDVNRLTTLS